jgi:hypothetical protein
MLSHDLAKALLARRNNDVKVEVILNHIMLDKDGEVIDDAETKPDTLQSVPLRDHIDSEPYKISSNHIVEYNSLSDTIVIRASIVSYYTEEEKADVK